MQVTGIRAIVFIVLDVLGITTNESLLKNESICVAVTDVFNDRK